MQIIDINGNIRECKSAAPDNDYPGFIKVEYVSKNRKGYTYFEWYQITDFIRNNPKLANLTKGSKTSAKEDLGAVTKAGENWISDTTKNWPEDIFKKNHVWISRGRGEGQQRVVVKNDRNKLYLNRAWKIQPDSTSQYVISFNVSKDIKPAGNTLPGIETKTILESMIKKAKKSLVN